MWLRMKQQPLLLIQRQLNQWITLPKGVLKVEVNVFRILIVFLMIASRAYASDEMPYHETCINGNCVGHLEGCVKFCDQ